MHVLDLGDVELLALRLEIDRLTAGHAEGAAGLAQHVDQTQPHRRRGRQCRIARQQLKRQRLQRIAHQHRGGLVEGLVTGGPAAPQVVVIHRRQIVMDQRVDVDEFDGAGDGLDLILREPTGWAVANVSAGRIRLPPPSTL